MTRLAAITAALMQTAEAVPFGMHFEERGHLNEVREDAGPVEIAIVREEPLTFNASVRVRTVNRTALAGSDYGAIDQVVKFAPFQNRVTIKIPITKDFVAEGNERFRLVLTNAVSGVLAGENVRESLYINDAQDDPANDDFAASIFLAGSRGSIPGTNRGASREPGEPFHGARRNRSVWYYYQAPADGFAAFRSRNKKFSTLLGVYTGSSVSSLTRKRSTDDSDNSDDSVDFQFEPDDSDQFNAQYVVRVAKGEVLRIAVEDRDDSNDDSDDSDDPNRDVEDSDDSNDGHGGGGLRFLLRWNTILPGRLEFARPVFTGSESAGSARVTILRRGGADNTVRVRLTTIDGGRPGVAAVDGEDYEGFDDVVTFAKGERMKTVDIPILDDTIFEQTKAAGLLLRRPGNGATLGLRSARLVIRDDDPFTPGAGKYVASILPATFSHENTGRLAINVTALGVATGSLQYGGITYPFTGVFDGSNSLVFAKTLGRLRALVVRIQLSADGSSLTGTLEDHFAVVAQIAGARNGFDARTNPSPRAGRYTMLLPGDDQSTVAGIPKGDGWAWLNVTADGTARIAGVLADGRPFSTGIALSASGNAPFYQALYRGQGSLSGAIQFTANPGVSDAAGTLHWFKRGSFDFDTTALVSAYAATPGQRLLASLDAGNGAAVVTFGEGGLLNDLSQPVVIDTRNVVSLTSPVSVRLALTLNPTHGLFAGTFRLPGTRRDIPFRGVVFQVQGRAGGNFLRGTQSGFARIGLPPN